MLIMVEKGISDGICQDIHQYSSLITNTWEDHDKK